MGLVCPIDDQEFKAGANGVGSTEERCHQAKKQKVAPLKVGLDGDAMEAKNGLAQASGVLAGDWPEEMVTAHLLMRKTKGCLGL
eukprot:6465807-Amphidinium_carterae.2